MAPLQCCGFSLQKAISSETLGSEHAFNTAASKGPAPLGCHLRVTAYAATPHHASRTLPRANQFLGCRADGAQVGQDLTQQLLICSTQHSSLGYVPLNKVTMFW